MLGAQLIFQTLFTILALWVALITGLVWHEVGIYLPQLDHVYFGLWIICSILGETPLLNRLTWWISIRFNGVQLRLDAATAWLAGPELYRHTFYQAFYHAATNGWGWAIDLVPIGLVSLLIAWRLRQNPSGSDHLRGLQLVTPRQHNRQLNGSWLKRLYRAAPLGRLNRPAGGSGIRLGQSLIPQLIQFEHFAVFGSPGSGKSTLMRQMLKQIQERRQPAIVLDVDSEFVQEFYSPARGGLDPKPAGSKVPTLVTLVGNSRGLVRRRCRRDGSFHDSRSAARRKPTIFSRIDPHAHRGDAKSHFRA